MSHSHGEASGIFGQLTGLWMRVPPQIRLNLENNFLPENPMDRPMPGEEVQLELRLAGYRDLVSHYVLGHFRQILLITLALCVLTGLIGLANGMTLWIGLGPLLLLALVTGYAIYERIEYVQWRLIKTNARMVISLPQHGSWPLVDNIELKGMPSVVDTNWSQNPLWRIFQAFTGARDLYLSLVGYQFHEGTARVTGALIIPDIMPQDVYELKKQIFKPFPPPPGKVRFIEPQEIKLTEMSDEASDKLAQSIVDGLRGRRRPAEDEEG